MSGNPWRYRCPEGHSSVRMGGERVPCRACGESYDPIPQSMDSHAPGDAVNFAPLAESSDTSWQRATPESALIESTGRYGYLVTLPDGDAHLCALAVEDAQHVGVCDCQGWEHNAGPCAHLCTVRKAAFLESNDVRGDTVKVPTVQLDKHNDDERTTQDAAHVDDAQRTDATGGRR